MFEELDNDTKCSSLILLSSCGLSFKQWWCYYLLEALDNGTKCSSLILLSSCGSSFNIDYATIFLKVVIFLGVSSISQFCQFNVQYSFYWYSEYINIHYIVIIDKPCNHHFHFWHGFSSSHFLPKQAQL